MENNALGTGSGKQAADARAGEPCGELTQQEIEQVMADAEVAFSKWLAGAVVQLEGEPGFQAKLKQAVDKAVSGPLSKDLSAALDDFDVSTLSNVAKEHISTRYVAHRQTEFNAAVLAHATAAVPPEKIAQVLTDMEVVFSEWLVGATSQLAGEPAFEAKLTQAYDEARVGDTTTTPPTPGLYATAMLSNGIDREDFYVSLGHHLNHPTNKEAQGEYMAFHQHVHGEFSIAVDVHTAANGEFPESMVVDGALRALTAAEAAKLIRAFETGKAESGAPLDQSAEAELLHKLLLQHGVCPIDFLNSVSRHYVNCAAEMPTSDAADWDADQLVKDALASSGPFLEAVSSLVLRERRQVEALALQRQQSRSQLPRAELQHPRCATLTNPAKNATVHVIGVNHLSTLSQADVRQIIRDVQPDAVCIELCHERVRSGSSVKGQDIPLPTLPVLLQQNWGKACFAAYWATITIPMLPLVWCFGALDVWDHAYVERAERLSGTNTGGEMGAALEESRTLGVPCYAIDRDISTTVCRQHSELANGGLTSYLSLVAEKVFQPEENHAGDRLREKLDLLMASDDPWSEEDVAECRALSRERMDGMSYANGIPIDSKSAPWRMGHAISLERDEYLARNLWRASQRQGSTTVAVVGVAHLQGIQKHFGHTTDARFAEISTCPSEDSVFRDAAPIMVAGVLGPPIATYAAYRSARRLFNPKLARRGVVGLGASLIAGAAYTAASTYNEVRRIQIETSPNRKAIVAHTKKIEPLLAKTVSVSS
jgi:pheromone shutdown protein TraB